MNPYYCTAGVLVWISIIGLLFEKSFDPLELALNGLMFGAVGLWYRKRFTIGERS